MNRESYRSQRFADCMRFTTRLYCWTLNQPMWHSSTFVMPMAPACPTLASVLVMYLDFQSGWEQLWPFCSLHGSQGLPMFPEGVGQRVKTDVCSAAQTHHPPRPLIIVTAVVDGGIADGTRCAATVAIGRHRDQVSHPSQYAARRIPKSNRLAGIPTPLAGGSLS